MQFFIASSLPSVNRFDEHAVSTRGPIQKPASLVTRRLDDVAFISEGARLKKSPTTFHCEALNSTQPVNVPD